MSQFDSTLSMCMRARRLAYGYDTVKAAAAAGQVSLLLTAADLSPKTVKEVEYLSKKHGVPHLRLAVTLEGMARVIGKKTGVIGITDSGFGARLLQIHNETEDNL